VYQLVFYFLVMEASLSGLGLDASFAPSKMLWKLFGRSCGRQGKKKSKSRNIKRGSYFCHR
jgi:hypothetical protein